MTPFLIAQAQGATAPASSTSGLGMLLFQVAAIIAIFYFVMIRPQQKERKRLEDALVGMKRGDEVVTTGGIIGEVVFIQMGPAADGAEPKAGMGDRVTIRSGESKLVVERGRITRVTPKGS